MDEATKRHEKVLFGNGKTGLIEDVVILKQTVDHMNEHLDSLSTSYAALSKSQVEYDTTQRLRFKSFKTIATIFGIAIPLTALIIKLL